MDSILSLIESKLNQNKEEEKKIINKYIFIRAG